MSGGLIVEPLIVVFIVKEMLGTAETLRTAGAVGDCSEDAEAH